MVSKIGQLLIKEIESGEIADDGCDFLVNISIGPSGINFGRIGKTSAVGAISQRIALDIENLIRQNKEIYNDAISFAAMVDDLGIEVEEGTNIGDLLEIINKTVREKEEAEN